MAVSEPSVRTATMKKLFLLIAACSLLAACNTMQGMGKDIKKAGEKIEEAASK
jgi:predicted small secreted protein